MINFVAAMAGEAYDAHKQEVQNGDSGSNGKQNDMRKHSLVVFVVMIFASVWTTAMAERAADPSVGKWKLNVAQSKLPASQPGQAALKELMVDKREVGHEFELTVTGTRRDGSPISVKATHPQQGGVIKYQQGAPAEGISEVITVIGPGESYSTQLQNGKQVQVMHIVVSKDGKTLRATIKGTDAKGKSYQGTELFEKQ